MNNTFTLFDQYPVIALGLLALVVVMGILSRRGGKKGERSIPARSRTPLDAPLLHWTAHDTFRVRDLLNGGVLILGRAGSGKTSSSGRTLLRAIVSCK